MLGSAAARRRVLRGSRLESPQRRRRRRAGPAAGAGEGPGVPSAASLVRAAREQEVASDSGHRAGLPRLGSPLQSNSRRSPEERQAAAAARRSAVRSPQPCCLAFPHSISCHCNANPVTRYRLASPSRQRERRRRKRRSGAGGTGVGRKGREEGEGEGPAGRRVRVGSSPGHQPQLPPLPPPALFSKIAVSGAPPAKRGLRPAAPIPGAESRVQAPPLARERESQAETGSHTRLRVPTGTARVLFASALPPPGGGMGAVGTGGSLEEGAAEGVPRLG